MLKYINNNLLNSLKTKELILGLVRISIGFFFFTTGYNKLFVESNQKLMLETIIQAGIPFPEFTSIFVSSLEFGLGLLLIIGLFTQLSSIILLFICLVALFTIGLHSIPTNVDLITTLSWFFYIHDLLYIFILLVIISNKPDIFTLDRKVFKVSNK